MRAGAQMWYVMRVAAHFVEMGMAPRRHSSNEVARWILARQYHMRVRWLRTPVTV